jgi:hypothetical protein
MPNPPINFLRLSHSLNLPSPKIQRNIPTRGLRPVYYLLGVGLVMAYGWRKIFIGAREKKYATNTPTVPPSLPPAEERG